MFGWETVEKAHVVALLGSLKELFADPAKWVFWPKAEDKSGLAVDPTSDQAVKWCLLGAGEKLAAGLFAPPLDQYVECATRDVLNEMSDGKLIHGMSYDDEYALICLAHEDLTKEAT